MFRRVHTEHAVAAEVLAKTHPEVTESATDTASSSSPLRRRGRLGGEAAAAAGGAAAASAPALRLRFAPVNEADSETLVAGSDFICAGVLATLPGFFGGILRARVVCRTLPLKNQATGALPNHSAAIVLKTRFPADKSGKTLCLVTHGAARKLLESFLLADQLLKAECNNECSEIMQ